MCTLGESITFPISSPAAGCFSHEALSIAGHACCAGDRGQPVRSNCGSGPGPGRTPESLQERGWKGMRDQAAVGGHPLRGLFWTTLH